jgi:biotin transport system substrate-specific component
MEARNASLSAVDIARRALPLVAASFGMALMMALSARASFLTPFSPVPVSLQVAVVLLAGFVLGSKWGSWSVAQYIGLGLMGAPVFAMGLGGPAVCLEPSFGYLLAFLPAAWVVGRLAEGVARGFPRGILIGTAGVMIIYLGGAGWLAGVAVLGGASFQGALRAAWLSGIAPFVLVDLLKVVLCAGIWAAWPTWRVGRR